MLARFLAMSIGALIVVLATGPEATAACGLVCGPCHPCFSFCARGTHQVVKPGAKLPLEVLLANHECYWWLYFSSEYRYQLIDDQGHEIPNAFILPTEFRKIWVPPCALLLDRPTVILKKEVPVGRWYTMIVTLRGHRSSLCFMTSKKSSEASDASQHAKQSHSESTAVVSIDDPKKPSNSSSPASPPATAETRGLIEVSLPADAKVKIHGHLTSSTGTKRTFASPPLLPRMAYTYTVTAEVERQGKVLSQSRSIVIRPGQRTPVRFDFPLETARARTER